MPRPWVRSPWVRRYACPYGAASSIGLQSRVDAGLAKILPCVELIVSSATQPQILDRVRAARRQRLNVIELETPPRTAPPPLRRQIAALLAIPQKHRARYRRRIAPSPFQTPRPRWLPRGIGVIRCRASVLRSTGRGWGELRFIGRARVWLCHISYAVRGRSLRLVTVVASLAMDCKSLLLQLTLVRFEPVLEQRHQIAAGQPMPRKPPHPIEQRTKLTVCREMHAIAICRQRFESSWLRPFRPRCDWCLGGQLGGCPLLISG